MASAMAAASAMVSATTSVMTDASAMASAPTARLDANPRTVLFDALGGLS